MFVESASEPESLEPQIVFVYPTLVLGDSI